ncbi:uncharacterized protein LOC119976543 isoform X2 [Scyliorhinus canicula]|nr:uncharacterized protein LOC119976543 isoform X2 [Scyliorhinus canicula]
MTLIERVFDQTHSNQTSSYISTGQQQSTLTTISQTDADVTRDTGNDIGEEWNRLTGTEISIGVSLGLAIGIAFSGCFFVFRRRIDACADWIYFSLSSKFTQEQLCTNDDSFSQSEEIVYADLHLLVLPGRPGGYSPETPILTHSQDLTHAQGDCSAEPVYTQGNFSSDQNVRVDLSANLTQIQGDFVGEERSEYASLNMINNQSQN